MKTENNNNRKHIKYMDFQAYVSMMPKEKQDIFYGHKGLTCVVDGGQWIEYKKPAETKKPVEIKKTAQAETVNKDKKLPDKKPQKQNSQVNQPKQQPKQQAKDNIMQRFQELAARAREINNKAADLQQKQQKKPQNQSLQQKQQKKPQNQSLQPKQQKKPQNQSLQPKQQQKQQPKKQTVKTVKPAQKEIKGNGAPNISMYFPPAKN